MAMAHHTHHSSSTPDSKRPKEINLVSLATLFIAIVAIALVLVGTATRGTTPLLVLPGMIVGAKAILDLRK
jgi:hypothetical protein